MSLALLPTSYPDPWISQILQDDDIDWDLVFLISFSDLNQGHNNAKMFLTNSKLVSAELLALFGHVTHRKQSLQNYPSGHRGGWGGCCGRQRKCWMDNITHHNSLSRTILQGTLEGGKCWKDNIKEWPCQNCSQGPHAEHTGRGSLMKHPLCPPSTPPHPPNNPIGQGIKLNWTELIQLSSKFVCYIYVDMIMLIMFSLILLVF